MRDPTVPTEDAIDEQGGRSRVPPNVKDGPAPQGWSKNAFGKVACARDTKRGHNLMHFADCPVLQERDQRFNLRMKAVHPTFNQKRGLSVGQINQAAGLGRSDRHGFFAQHGNPALKSRFHCLRVRGVRRRDIDHIHLAGLQQAIQRVCRAAAKFSAKGFPAIGIAPVHRRDGAKVVLREGPGEDVGDLTRTNNAPPRPGGQRSARHASTCRMGSAPSTPTKDSSSPL